MLGYKQLKREKSNENQTVKNRKLNAEKVLGVLTTNKYFLIPISCLMG